LYRSVIGRIDELGNELGWVRIENDPKALVAECRKAGRGVPVAIEATYGWYWAVDALLAAGFEVHLAHPLGLKALRKRKRVKTDPRDAYELANLLRLGSLPEAYISPPDLRELRELVRHRRQLVKLSTSVKAGMRALLAKHNIRLAATQLDSDTATGLMDALQLPGTYAQRLASQRRLMLVLADEIASVEVELHGRLRNHPGYRNLLTVKGIGPVLAATFVAEIGGISLSLELVSSVNYLLLVPFGIATALIGMCSLVLFPNIKSINAFSALIANMDGVMAGVVAAVFLFSWEPRR